MTHSQPNILLILSDQERYAVSAPDGPAVQTPNMDRLRKEGMYFEKAYTPISICSSARGSLLSGQYPHNHGMLNNCHEKDAIQKNFPTNIPTFGNLLKEDGYTNTYVGKWHVGQDQQPSDFGFEYFGGDDGGLFDDSSFHRYQKEQGVNLSDIELEDQIRTSNGDLIAAKASLPKEATRTYYLTERTIELLKEKTPQETPFFHRTDFIGPHPPYVIPEPYASMYDPDKILQWGSHSQDYKNKPAAYEKYLLYRGVDHLTWKEWSEAVAKYFGFVTFIDDQIGRILETLDELDIRNTAVIHTADHGDFTGGHRQFNKGPLMYEETYHIPLIARWPTAIEPGTVCEEFVQLLDLMPTFLDMADISIPQTVDGRSLVPLFRETLPEEWPEAAFAEYHGDEFGLYSQRMIRTKKYKFIYNSPDINEFYDLEEDPHELRNLIDSPNYQDQKEMLMEKMASWMKRTDDTMATYAEHILK